MVTTWENTKKAQKSLILAISENPLKSSTYKNLKNPAESSTYSMKKVDNSSIFAIIVV